MKIFKNFSSFANFEFLFSVLYLVCSLCLFPLSFYILLLQTHRNLSKNKILYFSSHSSCKQKTFFFFSTCLSSSSVGRSFSDFLLVATPLLTIPSSFHNLHIIKILISSARVSRQKEAKCTKDRKRQTTNGDDFAAVSSFQILSLSPSSSRKDSQLSVTTEGVQKYF